MQLNFRLGDEMEVFYLQQFAAASTALPARKFSFDTGRFSKLRRLDGENPAAGAARSSTIGIDTPPIPLNRSGIMTLVASPAAGAGGRFRSYTVAWFQYQPWGNANHDGPHC